MDAINSRRCCCCPALAAVPSIAEASTTKRTHVLSQRGICSSTRYSGIIINSYVQLGASSAGASYAVINSAISAAKSNGDMSIMEEEEEKEGEEGGEEKGREEQRGGDGRRERGGELGGEVKGWERR